MSEIKPYSKDLEEQIKQLTDRYDFLYAKYKNLIPSLSKPEIFESLTESTKKELTELADLRNTLFWFRKLHYWHKRSLKKND